MTSKYSISTQALVAGSLAGIVGFSSSFVIVLHGLQAAGASPAQSTSGIMALSIAMGLGGVILSLLSRMPISVAWSTPGAALLTTTGFIEGGYAGAVGAFLISSLLLGITNIFNISLTLPLFLISQPTRGTAPWSASCSQPSRRWRAWLPRTDP